MTRSNKGVVWILMLIFMGSIFLIFSMKPNILYRPLKNQTERTFVFEHSTNHDESTDQILGVSAMIKRIETEDFEVVELYFYDRFVVDQIELDLQRLYSIFLDINYSKPFDLHIIERDDDLEITIHGRFGNDWLYQKKTVHVSKYFNLLFPFIGGLTVTEMSAHLALLYQWGSLEAHLYQSNMTYESPFYMYYRFLKSPLENHKRAYNLSHYTLGFVDPHTEEAVLNTTQYVIIINPS